MNSQWRKLLFHRLSSLAFQILSIRGWRDRLITPMDIDKVFDHHQNLNWKKLSLPEAGHLNGLRDFPSEYRPGIEDFLTQFLAKN